MKVVWTTEALRKLDEIESFIAQDTTKRASAFIDLLLEKADLIGSFPDMGRVVPELSRSEIRERFIGNYLIVYRLFTAHIEVRTIFEVLHP